jgi:hypothetical protein
MGLKQEKEWTVYAELDKHGRKRGLFCDGWLGSRHFFYQFSSFSKSKLA